ncbi:MAG: hypothetical protein MRZ24_02325 [Clostridiales bacterium]|nr:hypothetical protein [Clostridiales bacterium]
MKDEEIKKGAGYLEELAGRLLQERIHGDDAVPDMNNMTEKQIIDYARQYDRRYYLSHRDLAQAERVDPYYRRHPELHRRLLCNTITIWPGWIPSSPCWPPVSLATVRRVALFSQSWRSIRILTSAWSGGMGGPPLPPS